MARYVLEKTRFRAGVWQGVLSGPPDLEPPALSGRGPDGPLLIDVRAFSAAHGRWDVRLAVPDSALGDGVHSFAILCPEGVALTRFDVIAGDALEDDIRAELASLRAEMDLMGSVLRRLLARDDG